MRKLLILALALIMIISLVACKGASDETTDTDPIVTGPTDTKPAYTEPKETEDTSGIYETAPIPETDAPVGDKFIEVNETVFVYGTDILNVRKEASADSEKMGEMKEGEQVTRVGYNEKWSKISYYGNIYYASSDYLTTSAPLEFADKTDTVYIVAEGTLNLRKKPTGVADIVAYLPYGTELSRTGIAKTADSEGITWSRLLYNGEVCYASTAFLSNEKPADIDGDFKALNETVYVVRQNGSVKVEALNIRARPSRSSNSIAVVSADTELIRIGIAKEADEEGIVWSKVIIEGKTGYVSSSYVTTDAPVSENANG